MEDVNFLRMTLLFLISVLSRDVIIDLSAYIAQYHFMKKAGATLLVNHPSCHVQKCCLNGGFSGEGYSSLYHPYFARTEPLQQGGKSVRNVCCLNLPVRHYFLCLKQSSKRILILVAKSTWKWPSYLYT